jgi:hypothetical protein
MPRRAKVTPKQLPNGSWYIDTIALAERIRRQIAGVGLDASLLREYEAVAHRLATVDAPCRGKSITWIADWTIANYRGDSSTKTIAEWATTYKMLKKAAVRPKTYREVEQYIDPLVADFGHLAPSLISDGQLEQHVAAHPSRWHREKILRPFFAWLAGAECSRLTVLRDAPLRVSPFAYIPATPYKREEEEVHILTIAQVRSAIELAIKGHPAALGQFVFLVLTGLRPDAEAPAFWTLANHGWRKIDFTRELEKTKKRNRQLVLMPNVVAWLQYFKQHGTAMVCPRRAWRKFKAAAYPALAHVQDLARHTALSNYAKRLSVVELEYQFATSQDMIVNHYLSQIADDAEVDEFFGLTPASFGLQ